MAALYANEALALPVVLELRKLGHDVLTVQEAGNGGRAVPDDEVLAYAIQKQRAVVTVNRKDFEALHKTTPEHYGIIVCTVDTDFAGQAARIDAAITAAGTLDRRLVAVFKTPGHRTIRGG